MIQPTMHAVGSANSSPRPALSSEHQSATAENYRSMFDQLKLKTCIGRAN
jgi:hypothetical protein